MRRTSALRRSRPVIDPQDITLLLAFFGGFISFISPCVLPLVPAYLGYLSSQASSGLATAGAAAGGGMAAVQSGGPSRVNVFLHGVFFVVGFSIVFVLLGLGAGLLGSVRGALVTNLDIIGYIGGVFIIILGLHTMGVIRIPFLAYDTRKQMAPRKDMGYAGSGLMGVFFSAGWSPCIGPILGAVLTLGFSEESVGQAALLLVAYSAGLGIPFLLAAAAMDRATEYLRRFQKHMRKVEIASGVFLIVIGVLVFTGWLQRLSNVPFLVNFTYNLDMWINENVLGISL
jgi:cytochrome c-type biogenesis protein